MFGIIVLSGKKFSLANWKLKKFNKSEIGLLENSITIFNNKSDQQ